MATAKKATKQVHWIARYAFKTNGKLNGIVTYAVRSSNGKDIYCTTFIEGKASGCSCPSHTGSCYHRTQLAALEAARKAVAPVVATPVEVAPVQEYRMSEGVYAKLAVIAGEKQQALEPKQTIRAKVNDVGQRGNLNGAAQTTQMPAWLAILPSRQRVATHA